MGEGQDSQNYIHQMVKSAHYISEKYEPEAGYLTGKLS